MQADRLRDLYQEVIIDHNRNPRHFHALTTANRCANGFNPLCGDKIQLSLQVNADDVIEKAAFTGNGCAISIASASLMLDTIQGLPLKKVLALFDAMHQLLTNDTVEVDEAALGKLAVLAGVKAFPARVKCATLAWHTLNNALSDQQDTATTE